MPDVQAPLGRAVSAYYNESNPYCAQWLRNLIDAGLLPPGDVDDRSIAEVLPDDLRPYRQVHLFAGIGGWGLACRMAGLPDDAPVWTGSCPCQPFSSVGRKQGASDERHLWPQMYRLARDCQPSVIFGEQVAGGLGRAWLSAVRLDMVQLGYAFGGRRSAGCGRRCAAHQGAALVGGCRGGRHR